LLKEADVTRQNVIANAKNNGDVAPEFTCQRYWRRSTIE
jgi:hypothetical protein